MAIRHILCAIDFSESAEFVLTYATALARTLDAKVTALHVVQALPGVLLEETGLNYDSAAGLTKEGERELDDLIHRCAEGGEVSVAIVSGHPPTQIVEQAQRLDADLIAIGTQGRTGLKNLLLGSVAERVLRLSQVPVLTVRGPGAPRNGAARIREILCPTDFSGASQSALDFAVELGKRLNAHIHLLHVFESPNYLGWETALSQSAPSMQLMQDLRERELEQLDELMAQSERGGAKVTAEQVDGSPYARIAEFSERFDLVIMGSRGRTGLPKLFLGSVAERVVRLARCPVICVRGPEGSEAPA